MSSESLPDLVAGRYRPLCLLGRGGMGEVWRVRDELLHREVAFKLVRGPSADDRALARFLEEARIAAQLQHPGIVPVHDLGRLPDGRAWFTMAEVRGRTLEALADAVHRAWRLGRPAAEDGTTARRLVELFHRVCETVAYAHARGVVHRDLKLTNVMVGRFGEVLVLDWGLAKALGTSTDPVERAVAIEREEGFATRAGAVAGTPSYMSPEQASGRAVEVGPAADVHALGGTLYHLLADRPPRLARDADDLLRRVAAGSPLQPPSKRGDLPLADEILDAICLRALATDPAARHADAAELAKEVGEWLDGARRRERALSVVAEARALVGEAEALEAGAVALRSTAAAALAALPRYAPPEDKHEAWDHQDRAAADLAAAELARGRSVQLLRGALTHAPDLREAHDGLADAFHRGHVRLEAEGRTAEAAQVELALREHDRSGRYAAYLSGRGALTLLTDPEGAEARLFRMAPEHRRLVPVFERVLGRTPLVEVPLDRGSWLLEIEAPGRPVVRYPVAIGRLEHWHGVPPGATEPFPIPLPAAGELGEDDVYVPAGWFGSGADDVGNALPARWAWADGFVIRRFPVTVGEYVAFLNTLAPDEAERLEPRLREADEPFLERDADGRFVGIRTDRQGEQWELLPRGPTAPMVLLRWDQALACAERLGWRLPMEREWEKAARGVDRRRYPWGEVCDPGWCRLTTSAFPPTWVDTRSYETDVSPYGVRGLGGNVADWVADAFPATPEAIEGDRVRVRAFPDADRRVAKGGWYAGGPSAAWTHHRHTTPATQKGVHLAVRLARTFF